MSHENAALIQGLYAAFAVGDVAAVMGAMSPDIIWNEAENHPYADGNPYVGPQAVAEGVFARLGGEWDGLRLSSKKFSQLRIWSSCWGAITAPTKPQAARKTPNWSMRGAWWTAKSSVSSNMRIPWNGRA